MDEVRLTTPVTAEAISRLKLGDVVYLDGILYTAREGVYRKVVDLGLGLPAGVRQLTNVTFHCSPAPTVRPDGSYAGEANEQWKLTLVSCRTLAGRPRPRSTTFR